jgi:MFS family permease
MKGQLLSSSPTLATTAAPTPPQHTSHRRSTRRGQGASLPWRYLGYVGYYVGAGLISGAVVHHPMDPTRYSMIAGAGVLVFLVATVLNDIILATEKPALSRMVRVLGTSTMLSFGLGMLSGGMQHFADLPDRCAVLIPLGIVLSFVAYFLKEDKRPWRRIFGLMGLAVLVVTVLTFAGLRHIAPTLAEGAGGGHSHSDAETEKGSDEGREGDHGSGTADPTSEPTAPTKDTHPSEEPRHEDGHNH